MRRIIGTIKNNNPFPLFQHYGHIPAKEHKGGGVVYRALISFALRPSGRWPRGPRPSTRTSTLSHDIYKGIPFSAHHYNEPTLYVLNSREET